MPPQITSVGTGMKRPLLKTTSTDTNDIAGCDDTDTETTCNPDEADLPVACLKSPRIISALLLEPTSNRRRHNVGGFYYLSPQAQKNLPQFQYHGEDLSLLYNYVLSPLAGRLVERLPRTIAPNTITLVGLMFMVSSYFACWYYSPDLRMTATESDSAANTTQALLVALKTTSSVEIPRWIFLWNSISMLLYQTFDNMDGKQARRTQSNSPLGLLFDHGCDAINSLFGSVNWIIAMSMDPRDDWRACWILLLAPYALFYVGTWEEYYTGSLILPIVNGPNEGLLGGALLHYTTFLYGTAYWQTTTWSAGISSRASSISLFAAVGTLLPATPLRNADWVVLLTLLGSFQECFLKIVCVVRQYGSSTIINLVPFLTLLGCSGVLMMDCRYFEAHSNANDTSTAACRLRLWDTHPRTFLHLVACLFVEMATALMLSHISQTNYQPWRWILVPLILLTVAETTVASAYRYSTSSNDRVETLSDLWLWYAGASCMYVTIKTCGVIHEICALLDIDCFSIPFVNPVTPPSTS